MCILIGAFSACDNNTANSKVDKQESNILSEDIRLLISTYRQKIQGVNTSSGRDSSLYWNLEVGDIFADHQQWDSLYEIIFDLYISAYSQRNFDPIFSHLARYGELIRPFNDTIWAKIKGIEAYGFYMHGDWKESIKIYDKVVPIWEEYDNSSRLLSSLNTLGTNYTILGDFALAESTYRRAIAVEDFGNDTSVYKANIFNLGKAQLSQYKWEDAAKNFRRAHTITPYKYGFFDYHMGLVCLFKGEPEEALFFAQSTREKYILAPEESRLDWSQVTNLLGRCFLELGQMDKAESYLQQSLEATIMYYPPGHGALGEAHIYLGDVYEKQGLHNLAIREYHQAIQVFLPAFKSNNVTDCPSSDDLMSKEIWLKEALSNKGRAYINLFLKNKKHNDAYIASIHFDETIKFINKIRLSFTEADSKAYLGSYSTPFYEDAIHTKLLLQAATQDNNYLTEAYYLARQSTAFLLRESVNDERAMTIGQVPADTVNLLQNLNKQISELSEAATEAPDLQDSLQTIIFQRKRERIALLDELEQHYPLYYQLKHDLQPASLDSLQSRLADSTLVIDYFMGEEQLYTFVYDKQQLQVYTTLLDSNFLQQIQQYRKTLADLDYIREQPQRAEQEFVSSSYYLYQTLIDSVWQHFPNTDFNRLLIVPDGILNYLSFECLLQQSTDNWLDRKAFLVHDFAVRYAYYADLLLANDDAQEGNRFLGFGTEYNDATLEELNVAEQDSISNPDLQGAIRGKNLSKLLFADDEVLDVAELTDGQSFVNEQATKANFLRHSENYDIVHIAAHSFIDDENDSTAYIAFHQNKPEEDFLLSLPEIYSMQLDANMVSLSSCQTGLGALERGEGVMSLARAFNFAGSKSMLASQWSIVDQSSYAIMTAFYRYLDKGLSKDIALQKAKLDYLYDDKVSSPAYRIPPYWAAIIMVGDESPVVFVPAKHSYEWLWVLVVAGLISFILLFLHRQRSNA